MATVSTCSCGPTTCSSADLNSTASAPCVTRTRPIITSSPDGGACPDAARRGVFAPCAGAFKWFFVAAAAPRRRSARSASRISSSWWRPSTTPAAAPGSAAARRRAVRSRARPPRPCARASSTRSTTRCSGALATNGRCDDAAAAQLDQARDGRGRPHRSGRPRSTAMSRRSSATSLRRRPRRSHSSSSRAPAAICRRPRVRAGSGRCRPARGRWRGCCRRRSFARLCSVAGAVERDGEQRAGAVGAVLGDDRALVRLDDLLARSTSPRPGVVAEVLALRPVGVEALEDAARCRRGCPAPRRSRVTVMVSSVGGRWRRAPCRPRARTTRRCR